MAPRPCSVAETGLAENFLGDLLSDVWMTEIAGLL
jgi:hypothetical protein